MERVSKKNTGGMRISGSRTEAMQVLSNLRKVRQLKDAGITKQEFQEKREENLRRDIR